MAGAPTRVLIVDDHAVFTDALARALGDEPDIEVVATADSGSAALAALGRGVDVALCDFRLPDTDGIQLTTQMLASDPTLRVVMLTASTDDTVLAAAVNAGCVGFLSKAAALEEVLEAVRSAAVGESVISPALLARLLSRMGGRGAGSVDDLTPREHEVLGQMAKGLSNQAIGDALYVSRDTVRNHVANILRKLGAHSKLEAVATAARRGIIGFDAEP